MTIRRRPIKRHSFIHSYLPPFADLTPLFHEQPNAGLERRALTTARFMPCMRDMLIARPLQAFVIPLRIVAGFYLHSPERGSAALTRPPTTSDLQSPHSQRIAARCALVPSLALCYWFSNPGTRDNAALQRPGDNCAGGELSMGGTLIPVRCKRLLSRPCIGTRFPSSLTRKRLSAALSRYQ
jgi:hypothetical protein